MKTLEYTWNNNLKPCRFSPVVPVLPCQSLSLSVCVCVSVCVVGVVLLSDQPVHLHIIYSSTHRHVSDWTSSVVHHILRPLRAVRSQLWLSRCFDHWTNPCLSVPHACLFPAGFPACPSLIPTTLVQPRLRTLPALLCQPAASLRLHLP